MLISPITLSADSFPMETPLQLDPMMPLADYLTFGRIENSINTHTTIFSAVSPRLDSVLLVVCSLQDMTITMQMSGILLKAKEWAYWQLMRIGSVVWESVQMEWPSVLVVGIADYLSGPRIKESKEKAFTVYPIKSKTYAERGAKHTQRHLYKK